MYPFPATLDGAPVTVYQLTEDRHACIARADGRLDYVLVTSLRVAAPTPDDEPDEPTKPLVWGKWQHGYSGARVRLSADGARIQEIAESALVSCHFQWMEREVNGSVIQMREGFASFGDAQEACEAFSEGRGDEQPQAPKFQGDTMEHFARLNDLPERGDR